MKSFINFYLLEYAINSLLRQKSKNGFVLFVLTTLILLLSSVFFIAHSIKDELHKTLKPLPDITIQKLVAGKHTYLDKNIVQDIIQIAGVKNTTSRIWGYYYFQNAGVNFSIVGIDKFESQYKEKLTQVIKEQGLEKKDFSNSMVVGDGVKKILQKSYYNDYFNFILPNGKVKKVFIIGSFDSDIQLESNDMIILPKKLAREIFKIEEDKATDIIVNVSNEEEIFTIATKIQAKFPNLRVITKKELEISYENIFDYKSGIFLLLFIICLFTFAMIIYDRISGLTSGEKKEIGILKALGWKISDVLKEKFYEAFIISTLAYLIGVILSLCFVFVLNAPVLRELFTGYSVLKTDFNLPFVLDIQTLILVFLLSVPIYIASIIIPSFKAASIETDKVLR